MSRRLTACNEMEKKYKVYNLTTDGPVEIDFKDWASDVYRDHPIAVSYKLQKGILHK